MQCQESHCTEKTDTNATWLPLRLITSTKTILNPLIWTNTYIFFILIRHQYRRAYENAINYNFLEANINFYHRKLNTHLYNVA